MKPFIVLVTGGRLYTDYFELWTVLDVLHLQRPITHLMTGAAPGADTIADRWAEDRGVQPVVCRALWRKFGPRAGPRRNWAMSLLRPHLVVAAPGNVGTADMVAVARASGIEVREILADNTDGRAD